MNPNLCRHQLVQQSAEKFGESNVSLPMATHLAVYNRNCRCNLPLLFNVPRKGYENRNQIFLVQLRSRPWVSDFAQIKVCHQWNKNSGSSEGLALSPIRFGSRTVQIVVSRFLLVAIAAPLLGKMTVLAGTNFLLAKSGESRFIKLAVTKRLSFPGKFMSETLTAMQSNASTASDAIILEKSVYESDPLTISQHAPSDVTLQLSGTGPISVCFWGSPRRPSVKSL